MGDLKRWQKLALWAADRFPKNKISQDLAYKIISDRQVGYQAGATTKDVVRNVFSSKSKDEDTNKYMFVYGADTRRPETTIGQAYDWSKDIKENGYENVKTYRGVLNPYNEYLVDSRNKGLVEEFAKVGYSPVSNINNEYIDWNTYRLKQGTPYFDDVHSYRPTFHFNNGQPVISSSDLYDFGKNYVGDFADLYAERSGSEKDPAFTMELQRRALNAVGQPYRLVQKNIPIRFVDNPQGNEIWRTNNFNKELRLDEMSDREISDILHTGYIEPSVVTAYKKGGRIHIKKKNRGKFTAAAKRAGMGVQEFARHVLANKDKYSPTLVKRANFARNSKKFKHENGGILKAQEGTGNLYTPHPLSPVGIALNQARSMAKGKTHLPPGVKEVVGPDGKKVAIRTEQPLVPLEQSIAEWLPGTGDVAEVGYIANDIKNGNYGSAALAAVMITLPGNVGKVLRKSDVPTSKLTDAERLGIPKGERNQPLNGHLKGDAAVQMFKEYGTQFPEDMVRLYRASGTSGNFKPSLDGTAKYSGMWFTDDPRKVNRYASSTFKTAKRNGVDNPIVLEYIDLPKSQLDQFRAKNIIKGNDVEFEPTEDFLIPVDHAGRKQVSWTEFTGNYLSDMRIPHPELPPIPKNSKIYSQIQQLVPEARERYKLVGRTDITDDEIAGSLYKRAMELSGNSNAAIWETGEPRLLFRGDTRRYNRLMDKWSPEKLAKGKGTMDNSLGNLFLGDISGKGQGVDRYFISGTDFFEPRIQGSATGARGKFGTIFDGGGEGVQGTVIPYIPKDAYKLATYQTASGPYSLYKFPGKYSESGISDLNAFITRTPAMRDATGEISVLADDFVMKTKNYRGPNIDDYDGPTYDGINSTVRDAMAKHYQSILDDAQSKGQGLLFSEGLTDEYVKKFGGIHPFRREHERYDYYALPNFNRQNVKHLFGWDLRRPVQWDVDNIYLEKGGKL